MPLTTIDDVLAEIAKLEGLLTGGSVADVSERAAIRTEKAALIGRLTHLEQQQGKRNY
jgi:hypothetical protein